MFFTFTLFKPMRTLMIVFTLSALGGVHAVAPVPSQRPLVDNIGGSVPANFMITLDDSGSMAYRHLPETVFSGGTYATTNPVGGATVRWDPKDDFQYLLFQTGTVPGNISSANWRLKALRSPDTNSMFYNPETLYLPWATSANTTPITRLPNSPVATAYKDPTIRTPAVAATVINLTQTTAVGVGTSGYCYAGPSNSNCNSTTAAFTHDPGVYFRLGKQIVSAGSFVVGVTYTIKSIGTTNFMAIGAKSNVVDAKFIATGVGSGSGTAEGYKAIDNPANYTGYSINSAGPFPKVADRTDCSGSVGSTGCLQAQERQNFANWFSYYRTRNLLARGAVMEAFQPIGNSIRVGFGTINTGTGSVDGVSTKVIESSATYGGGGVREFNQTRKDQLFSWLTDAPWFYGGSSHNTCNSCTTPLPAALDAIGAYYSRTDSKGPYVDTPGTGPAVTSPVWNNVTNNTNVACRRSYQLMVTDGYWNGTPPSVGNQDGTNGLPIVEASGSTYTFQANTPPYADSALSTLADVAMKYWKNDIQPNMANKVKPDTFDVKSSWQVMNNFMVGLGVRGALDPTVDLPFLSLPAGDPKKKNWGTPTTSVTSVPANIDDLWHAAVNSRGAYYDAKDPGTLKAAVASALAGAQLVAGSSAGVATVSSVLKDGNIKYVPGYDPIVWSGDVKASPLDGLGQTGSEVWSAAARMPEAASRNIYTWNSSSSAASTSSSGTVEFKWGTPGMGTTVPPTMTNGSESLVNFLRGDHSNEAVSTTPSYRERKNAGVPFVLGDFVNSNPVLIKGLFDGGYGGLGLGGASAYQVFAEAKGYRDPVLFVGGNGGMLHGFRGGNTPSDEDGKEVYAYVPKAVYPNLYKLSDKTYGAAIPAAQPHQFYVDGPQQEADAYVAGPAYPEFPVTCPIGPTGSPTSCNKQPACSAGAVCWRNYLLGSLGAGGRAVYAMDVTSSPTFDFNNMRWEISSATQPDLGYVMAPIEVGVLPNDKWVAIFGNGLSSTNEKATLFVVYLETGAVTKLDVDTLGSNGLGGVGVVRDAQGKITNLYAGDLKGNLWKFDYSNPGSSTTASPFVITPTGTSTVTPRPAFFTVGTGQAITQRPEIFNHSMGGKIVVFGTGKLFVDLDRTNTDVQTIYGIWDKASDTLARPLSKSNLVSRTLSSVTVTIGSTPTTFYKLAGTTIDWGTKRGWFIDLNTSSILGGRVLYPNQAVSPSLVLVTAMTPSQSTAICESGKGAGVDFIIDVEPGMASTAPLFDTNGDGVVNDVDDPQVVGKGSDSSGQRALVRGLTGTVAGKQLCLPGFVPVSVQTATGQSMICVPDLVPVATNRVLKRIVRRIINPPIH